MTLTQTSWLPVALVLGNLAANLPLRAAEPNFVAGWSDDSRSTADEVVDWQRLESRPTLGGRLLLDAKNPIRWLCDTRLIDLAPASARVEFVGGDCLPGRVVAYAEHSTGSGSLACLMVAPGIDVDLPGQHRELIAVRLDLVRRIIWQPHGAGQIEPGSLVLADGRRLAFRSIRWNELGVEVLAGEQPARFALDELAELHLPEPDAWDAHVRMLALLSPDLSARLMRLDAAGGSRITTSLARFQARSVGGDAPQKWFHLVQPAWTQEALCIAHRLIRLRTFASPQAVPLCWFRPAASRHRGTFSPGWSEAQIDKNVQGGPLCAGGQPYGWGFGTHAHHELEFDLPASARTFHTRIGLDQVVAGGGCARARILVGGKAVFASPLLIGSGKPADSGILAIGATGPVRLALVADAAAQDRPPGADPFDVRDAVDWLEPVIGFDPVELRREIARAADRALWGPTGWTADAVAAGSWRVVNRFSDADHAHPRFRSLVALDAAADARPSLAHRTGANLGTAVAGAPAAPGEQSHVRDCHQWPAAAAARDSAAGRNGRTQAYRPVAGRIRWPGRVFDPLRSGRPAGPHRLARGRRRGRASRGRHAVTPQRPAAPPEQMATPPSEWSLVRARMVTRSSEPWGFIPTV